MPLPGGPSDKFGNRFEVRWTVRRFVDLVTGRLDWIRLEPPGQHAIEFRCGSTLAEQAHQAKRGLTTGHWTVAALGSVLEGFGALLEAEPHLECVFVSEHAAPELKELSDRARSASDLREFAERFLGAKTLAGAWSEVLARWNTTEQTAWERLCQLRMVTISERQLQDDTDSLLGLLFDAPPTVTRALLTDLVLDSVHKHLSREDVLRVLEGNGVRPVPAASETITSAASPPAATGIRRSREIQSIREQLAAGTRTLLIGGLSGIGKSTLASQFSSEWKGPVCWIDCGLLASESDALVLLADFAQNLGAHEVRAALSRAGVSPLAVARAAGRALNHQGALLIWDGVDDTVGQIVLPLVDAIAPSQAVGAQILTAQRLEASGRAGLGAVHVGRLDASVVRLLLATAFPEAKVSDLEKADALTGGHPYLVQLLTAGSTNLTLQTALDALASGTDGTTLMAELLSDLPEHERGVLKSLAWLGIPFTEEHVGRLGGSVGDLADLAARFLVVRAGSDRYRVHELFANLLKRSTPEEEALELHQRLALCLRSLPRLAPGDVRALLRHARAASMKDVVLHAGRWLLRYAADAHVMPLAREAAEALVQDGGLTTEFYPHYILGKSSRTRGDLDAALRHYIDAEVAANRPADRDVARYERASVLCELGRRDEAEPMFQELAQSDVPATKVEALIALALVMARRGKTDDALRVIDEAVAAARAGGAEREEAEAWQSAGLILAEAERWNEARERLRKAHELRMALSVDAAWDVYGWYHLLACALRVERELRDPAGARRAARSLWRFSLLSDNLEWEVQSAVLMCMTDPTPEDPEIAAAVQRLRAVGHDVSREAPSRLRALEGFVLCEWCLGRIEVAVEAIAESLALGSDVGIQPAMFMHLPHNPAQRDPIVQLPNGVHGLLLPPGEDKAMLLEAASRVFDRRPELAKYAVVFEGTFDRPGRKPRSPRAAKKRRQRRKGSR